MGLTHATAGSFSPESSIFLCLSTCSAQFWRWQRSACWAFPFPSPSPPHPPSCSDLHVGHPIGFSDTDGGCVVQGKAAASASLADGSQAPGLVGSLGHSLASQSHLLNWADKTFGQGLTSLTKGVHLSNYAHSESAHMHTLHTDKGVNTRTHAHVPHSQCKHPCTHAHFYSPRGLNIFLHPVTLLLQHCCNV